MASSVLIFSSIKIAASATTAATITAAAAITAAASSPPAREPHHFLKNRKKRSRVLTMTAQIL